MPRPVRAITPMMIPAQAQVAATSRTPFGPFSRESRTWLQLMRVLFRIQLARMLNREDHKAARIGEVPRTTRE